MNIQKTIIPIASGKGGVGKSFFTANLAIALAGMGHETVVVDLDLGGANLHSFLGLSNRHPGIGDFLKARSAELVDLVVQTDTPHLQFLPGDGRTPFMANIPYAQKIRLITHLVKLPAQYILLDLGAGASFNTLDFFRLSSHGILITSPEYPSVMNMLGFLKNLIYRVIEGSFTRNQYIRDLMRSIYKLPMGEQKASIESLRSAIVRIDAEAGDVITSICNKYRPRIVFNMGEHPDELKIAEQISKSLRDLLAIEVDYFGFVFSDRTVRESVKKGTAHFSGYGESAAAKAIARIAERVVKYLERPVADSAQLLLRQTEKAYAARLNKT